MAILNYTTKDKGYTVSVTLPGPPPRAILVRGRTAAIIGWLVHERLRVEHLSIGQVLFHIGKRGVIPEWREHSETLPVEPDTEA